MRRYRIAVAAMGFAVAAACSDGVVAPDAPTQLAAVVPAGGTVNIDPATAIVIEFNHAIMAGMEDYIALHEGDLNGPVVQGSWTRSADGLRLTFQPGHPLKGATRYTLHIGGGMIDANGRMIGFGDHGQHMGGQWATEQMLHRHGSSMGSGWQHSNGTYGMVFTFTTR